LLTGSLTLYLTGAFLTAFVASLFGTYAVRHWARRRGYVDHPDNERRIHKHPTPNVGGTAVALATTGTFVAWSGLVVPDGLARPEILAMLAGGLAIFAIGLWDDIRGLSAHVKLLLQSLVAAGVFFGGVQILGVSFGGVWESQLSALISFAVTTVWIVGTTNAFNLIDGSDGVAAGGALFASISLAVVFGLYGDPLGALMATVLVGACLGFLFFNFPPASIFLGDCGSLFLGFTLASLAVITTQKTATLVAIAIPVVAFGVPLLDTAIAIVRRFLRHEPIFAADRGHIHHRLRDLGHSPRGVALLLYVAFAGTASLSMLLAAPGRTTVLPVFVVAGVVLILSVQRLNIPELAELTRVLGRGLQQRAVISHNLRVYSAAEAVSSAASGPALAAALERAFAGSEFSRLELWLPSQMGACLEGTQGVTKDGAGYLLGLTFERLIHPEQEVELRVPIFADGQCVGRLSLFRTAEGARLFTDVRLVARRLAPALLGTLRRLAVRAEAGQIGLGG
jgi:UDP-GlcNAc:undecaprenyl-phosphate GlcNAc-1-phosphate transferase